MHGLILLYLHALISHELFWTQYFLDNRSFYPFCVLHDMEGVRIPCLCILYSNANILNYVWTLGSFLISFRALYLSYHDIFFLSNWIFDCLLYSLKLSSPCYLCAIFDPQYSLTSFKYSSLDMCIWFHSYYEKCTPWGGTHTILAFWIFHPFWHLLPMGEKFRGFKGMVLYLSLVCA